MWGSAFVPIYRCGELSWKHKTSYPILDKNIKSFKWNLLEPTATIHLPPSFYARP